jgi:hypothetical protein
LDAKSHIKFYSFESESHSRTYISAFKRHRGSKRIITIIPILRSDSLETRFVAFTEDGNRLLFGASHGAFNESGEILLRAIRQPPSHFPDLKLIDADISLGSSVFIFNDQIAIAIARATRHSHDITKEIALFSVGTDSLIDQFHNEMIWQNLFPPQIGHFLAVKSVHIVTFSQSIDTLSRLLINPHVFSERSDSVRL